MMKLFSVVMLLCLAAVNVASPQVVSVGFSVQASVVDMPGGERSVLVLFHSDDPATLAFASEVSYRRVGSMFVEHTNAWCQRNYSGNGGMYLNLGNVTDVSARGWELTGFGRMATSN